MEIWGTVPSADDITPPRDSHFRRLIEPRQTDQTDARLLLLSSQPTWQG